jgi:hypothetical protein
VFHSPVCGGSVRRVQSSQLLGAMSTYSTLQSSKMRAHDVGTNAALPPQVLAGLVALGALVVFAMVCSGVLLRCGPQCDACCVHPACHLRHAGVRNLLFSQAGDGKSTGQGFAGLPATNALSISVQPTSTPLQAQEHACNLNHFRHWQYVVKPLTHNLRPSFSLFKYCPCDSADVQALPHPRLP